jgi:hypothetical protein
LRATAAGECSGIDAVKLPEIDKVPEPVSDFLTVGAR